MTLSMIFTREYGPVIRMLSGSTDWVPISYPFPGRLSPLFTVTGKVLVALSSSFTLRFGGDTVMLATPFLSQDATIGIMTGSVFRLRACCMSAVR